MNNSSESNLTMSEEESQEIINVFNYFFYSLVVFVGIPGNILVVWSLLSIRKDKVNKSYKILVINLAVNDIMMLITLPFTITELAAGPNFPFGSVMCVILWPIQTACFGAGIFSMVSLNVHRYYVISYPTNSSSINKITAFAVVLCWLIPTLITAMPYAVHLHLNITETRIECLETWEETSADVYTIYLFAVQYVLPLCIIATLNTLAIKRLKRGHSFRLNSANVGEETLYAHRRIVKMLVVIVFIFALFGLPGQIMWLLTVFTNVDDNSNFFPILSLVDIFPFMYCVLNPVVFFTYNIECYEKLKIFLSKIFFCCPYHWRPRSLSSTTGSRNDAVTTLLPGTRISESQDTSQSDGPKSDPYATAVPQYLLDEYKSANSSKVKPSKGLVPLALYSSLNGLYTGSDIHLATNGAVAPRRVSRLLGETGDKELFRESFVELLRTRNLNNELMKHLAASPETAIIEKNICETSVLCTSQ